MKNKILGIILILLFSFTSISFAEDSSNNEDYEDTKDNIDLYIDNQLSKINIDEVMSVLMKCTTRLINDSKKELTYFDILTLYLFLNVYRL